MIKCVADRVVRNIAADNSCREFRQSGFNR